MRHGIAYTYGKLRCRCDLCRQANTDAHREWRRRRGIRPAAEYHQLQKAQARHGVISRYKKGCRCDECREAARVQRARFRAAQRLREAS